jgi:hypothetical protein
MVWLRKSQMSNEISMISQIVQNILNDDSHQRVVVIMMNVMMHSLECFGSTVLYVLRL